MNINENKTTIRITRTVLELKTKIRTKKREKLSTALMIISGISFVIKSKKQNKVKY